RVAHAVRTARAREHFDVARGNGQPDRQRYFTLFAALGKATAVPALERMAKRIADAAPQAEPRGKHRADFAVDRRDQRSDTGGRFERLLRPQPHVTPNAGVAEE